MTDKKLSIIIVNYKVKDLLAQTIRSLATAEDIENCEIIVVDNNSQDGSKELIKNDFQMVNYIESKTNLGFGKACNLGAKNANGKYLMMLNPDTIISKNTLSFGINYLENHSEVGILGPKILNQDGSFQFQCRRSFPTPLNAFAYMSGLSKIFPKSKIFGAYNLTYLPIDEECSPDAVSGACFFIPKELFLQIGGFDEQFFMYGEDLDLCAKVKQAGFSIKYSPKTEIIHFKGRSSAQKKIKSRWNFYEAMVLFSRKYKNSYGSFFPNWLLAIGIWFMGGLNILSIIIKNSPVFLTDLFCANIFLPISAFFYSILVQKNFVYFEHLNYVLLSHLILSGVFMISLIVSKHYEKPGPSKRQTAKVVAIALLIIFAIYYLIHREAAFSRAIIFSASILSAISIVSWRTLVSPVSKFYKKYLSGFGNVVLFSKEPFLTPLINKFENETNTKIIKIISNLNEIEEKHSIDTLVIGTNSDWYSAVIKALSDGKLSGISILWLPPESDLTGELKLKNFMGS